MDMEQKHNLICFAVLGGPIMILLILMIISAFNPSRIARAEYLFKHPSVEVLDLYDECMLSNSKRIKDNSPTKTQRKLLLKDECKLVVLKIIENRVKENR